MEEFHIFSSCSRCLLGICTLFPGAPCSGSHLPLCVATVHGSFGTNFVHFPLEKWTLSSPRSSHPGNLDIISTSSIWQFPRASVYVAFGRISHIFIVTVDSDFPAQSALENLDIISSCSHMAVGGVLGGFSAFFALLRVVERQFSSPRRRRVLCHRGLPMPIGTAFVDTHSTRFSPCLKQQQRSHGRLRGWAFSLHTVAGGHCG